MTVKASVVTLMGRKLIQNIVEMAFLKFCTFLSLSSSELYLILQKGPKFQEMVSSQRLQTLIQMVGCKGRRKKEESMTTVKMQVLHVLEISHVLE